MDSAVSTASGEMLYRDLDREGLAPLWTRLICRTVLRERLTIAGKLLTTEQARHHAELDWHDRGNERSEPISIDGLDLHMVNLFDASFFEHDLNGGVPQVRPITIARFATAGRAADRELRAALELVPLDVVLRAIRNETDKPLCPVNAPATPWREPCLLKAIVERCCRFLLVPGRVDGWSKVNHEGATGARQCAGAFGRYSGAVGAGKCTSNVPQQPGAVPDEDVGELDQAAVAEEIDMRGQAAACSNPDISRDTILTKRLICLVRAIRGHKP